MAEHVVTFRQGVNGYQGTVDTQLSEQTPAQSYGLAGTIGVDKGTGQNIQVLLRFDDILSQIPAGAQIVSATLTLQTTNTGNGATLHRMLTSWADTATWNTLGNGVQANGIEARTAADVTTGATSLGASQFNVTSSVQAWADGAANNGWVFISQGTNGWDFSSAQGSSPPQLSITYIVPDGPANTPPVAVNDVAITAEDGSTVINVLANDSDADGHALSVTGVGTPAHGTVVLNQNGTITYTPSANYSGTDSFIYTIGDGNGGTASATVNISVTPVNDPPVANTDNAQVNAGGSVVINVLANDTDIDSASISLVAVGVPSQGTASINQNGTVTYTPAAGYLGADSFQYTISDGSGGTATGTAQVTVHPVNAAPVANAESVVLSEDHAITIAVLSNDTDADGDALSVTGVGQPQHGAAVINQNGTITYTPGANYNGTDSFTYAISDGRGGSSTATVSLTVNPINDAPVANADTGTVQAGNALIINVLANDTDVEADPLTVTGIGAAGHGTVVLNQNGTVTYTAATGYAGADSFTYSVSDGNGGSATASVNITVTAPPSALVQKQAIFKQGLNGYSGTVDTQIVQASPNTSYGTASTIGVDKGTGENVQVLLRFSDIFGSLASQVPQGAEIISATLTLDTTNTGDGATLHRMLTSWTDSATYNSLVSGVQTNNVEARTASDATVTAGSLGATTFDVTASVLAWLAGQPNYGWVFVSRGSNGWDFTSAQGANPPQLTINYRIAGEVPNTAPVAATDTATVAEDSSVVISVLANDTDADGNTLALTGVGSASHGSVVVNQNGTVTYTPVANYHGADSFTYTITDGKGGSAVGTVNVTVTSVNDAPSALNDAVTLAEDTSAIINVLGNDSDPDGDLLSVLAVGNAAHGTVVINQNGTLTYTPAANYNGSDSFTYTLSDSQGGTATGTVSVTVLPVNDNPVGVADTATTDQNQSVIIHVLNNDTDIDSSALSVDGIVTQPQHGVVIVNQDGTITYTPATDYHGSDSFIYRVSDGSGGFANATVSLTINQVIPTNSPPIAVQDTVTVDEDGSIAISVLGNDTDADNDLLSVTGIDTPPQHGNAVINQTGTIQYVPSANYNGTDSFTYTITDGRGGFATGTVNINVTPVNDGPIAAPDAVSVNEDTPISIDVLANDTDVDGDPLSVPQLGNAAHGTVTLNQNGTVTYTPTINYNGPDSFTYTASDGKGGTSTTTVNITVNPVQDAPIAANDAANVQAGNTVVINVLKNDSDPDGNPLTVTGIPTGPAHGTTVVNANGTISYTANTGFSGSDSFIYTISDGQGGVALASVNVTVNLEGFEDSYIATKLTSGAARNLEHGNASKSFYANGSWWAVLPDGANWSIHRFEGSTPAPNTMGGWTIASDALFSNSNRSELAWDDANQKLYVVSYSASSAEPHIKQLSFDATTQKWDVDIDVKLAGTGGVLSGSEWGNNVEISLGLDQNGVPVLTAIAAASQGEKGLHVAFATSADLSTWGTALVDADTKGLGGSNGNSKADIITFTQNGVDKIGIFYSRDGTGSDDDWSFAWHDTSSSTTSYGDTWNVEMVTNSVNIDNHMSAVSDGEFIYALIKDDNDAIWLLKGHPGAWDAPYLVVDGVQHNPSRPSVVLDETNDQIYVFYQESTSNPEGQIYMKVFDTANPVFDPEDLGILVMEGPGSQDFLDPQSPAHSVGDHTGGYFLLLAKNEQKNEVWYNDIMLGGDHQIV